MKLYGSELLAKVMEANEVRYIFGVPGGHPLKFYQGFAMIRNLQNITFKGRRISSEFINPDFVKLAETMGTVGLRITKPDEIRPVVEQALSNDRPTVIDVHIDTSEVPSFDARAEAMARAWGTSASLYAKLKMLPEILKTR